MEYTLDDVADAIDLTPWTSKVKSFTQAAAITTRMRGHDTHYDLSMETAWVALQAKLSAACKELLWKDVLLSKLEATLKHAEHRASAHQVELEHAFLEHTKQTMLVESLDAKLHESENAHAATRLSLADTQNQRSDMVDRCAAMARDLSVAQMLRDQSDRECREWKERCGQLETDRRQHMQALHEQHQLVFQWQVKHDDLERSLHQLEQDHQHVLSRQRLGPKPPQDTEKVPSTRRDQASQCVMAGASTCHTQTTQCNLVDQDELAMECKRASIARQQDLMTIASQAEKLDVLQADVDHWQTSCRRTVQAYKELRRKANMWKGCVATLLPMYQDAVRALEASKMAKANWTKAKQSFEAEGRRMGIQLKQAEEMLERANAQLALDQEMLVECKKREKCLGRTMKTREGKARELVAALQSTQTKLDALQAQYTKTKAYSKQVASRSSQVHAAWLQERADRLQAMDEIDAFRAALIACCECAVTLEDAAAVQHKPAGARNQVAPPSTTWTLEHMQVVTGIAEPLVYG